MTEKKDLIMLIDSWKAYINRVTTSRIIIKEKETNEYYEITVVKDGEILFLAEAEIEKDDPDRETKKFVAVKELIYQMFTGASIHAETMNRLALRKQGI